MLLKRTAGLKGVIYFGLGLLAALSLTTELRENQVAMAKNYAQTATIAGNDLHRFKEQALNSIRSWALYPTEEAYLSMKDSACLSHPAVDRWRLPLKDSNYDELVTYSRGNKFGLFYEDKKKLEMYAVGNSVPISIVEFPSLDYDVEEIRISEKGRVLINYKNGFTVYDSVRKEFVITKNIGEDYYVGSFEEDILSESGKYLVTNEKSYINLMDLDDNSTRKIILQGEYFDIFQNVRVC